MATVKQFLDEVGLRHLCTQLVNKVDLKFNSRITNVINADSTNDTVASTKAVYEYLTQSFANVSSINFELVTSIPTTGTPGIIYLIKEPGSNPNNNKYRQWVYILDEWVDLGIAEANLTNVWGKDELVPITNSEIGEIIDDVFK